VRPDPFAAAVGVWILGIFAASVLREVQPAGPWGGVRFWWALGGGAAILLWLAFGVWAGRSD